MTTRYLAVVNPAAGGGRCERLAGAALGSLRAKGIEFDSVTSHGPGHATELVRAAYAGGHRRFLAVGGDGTAFEIVNGLFPEAERGERPTLAFLPLGSGNSFLRDFSDHGFEFATAAILAGRTRPCDVLRATHKGGALYFLNLLSVGFAADVAFERVRRFKSLGELGYFLALLVCLARLRRRAFPLRVDGEPEFDRRRCLFLTFNNSKFTGGKMMIAPQADTADGLVEYVRWGPVGRFGLVRNLPGLYDGSHVGSPLASRRAARRIEFELEGPVPAMIDGEVLHLHCESLEVLPSALEIVA